MKKKYFLITILALMMSAVCFADSDTRPIPVGRLPQAARAFVKGLLLVSAFSQARHRQSHVPAGQVLQTG